VLGTVVVFFIIITAFGCYSCDSFAYNIFQFSLISPCFEAGNCLKITVKFTLSLWNVMSKMLMFRNDINKSIYKSIYFILPTKVFIWISETFSLHGNTTSLFTGIMKLFLDQSRK
jgi:hypothetical protein